MANRQFFKDIEGKIIIDNELVTPETDKFSSLINPKDDSVVSEKHPICGKSDVDRAVKSARDAFRGPWSRLPGFQRAAILFKWADLLEQNAEEAAYYESICSGRTVTQLSKEIPWIARVIRYYAGWCDKLEGDSMNDDDGFYKIVRHEPLSVCAGITPWNGPMMVLALKAAPALATANTFILKPPEISPLSSLFVAHLFAKAGAPPGVFNVVTGEGSTGALLAGHMAIQKVSFTGSVPTGRKIAHAANESNMKRVTLELGGKSPAIVFQDADLDDAISWLSRGITGNTGQACIASSRVYVHESVADKVIEGIKANFLKPNFDLGQDPQAAGNLYGPLVNRQQRERVKAYIEQGKKDAELVVGGDEYNGQGHYISPVIFKNPSPDASIYKEEIFGPVLCIQTFTSEEDVIERANDTSLGLAAYLFSRDVKRVLRVAKALEAGLVGVNAGVALFPNAPFGGYKTSGVGKELGRYALEDYTNTKTIFISTHSDAAFWAEKKG
ncbi:aldehyde dehydrogenase, allergen Cla h 10, partial [Aureobasidium melanogenum]